jgi:hypothetical protein
MRNTMAEVEYPISTYLPREVMYFDGTTAVLPRDYVLKEGNLRLFVPKNIYNIWELHVRIYQDGFIDGHFEVSRDYLEHLQYPTIPSIYEVFEFYRTAYDKLHIFDSVAGKWIKEVRTHYLVTLNPPKSLTPWEPIAIVVSALSAVGIIAYALSRLDKGNS